MPSGELCVLGDMVSTTLLMALCLQAATVALVRHRLGRGWWQRPVVMLVLAAVAYNGVSEVFLAIPSNRRWDLFRLGIGQ